MKDIKVYEIADYEYWASKLSKEETRAFYEVEMDVPKEYIPLDEIKEVDIDKMMVKWLTWNDKGKDHKYEDLTFREAIKRHGEYTEPYLLAVRD